MKPCKYCDAHTTELMLRHHRTHPVGKPLVRNGDGSYIVIEHDCGCPAIPETDEWCMTWWQYGCGLYIKISYCPICGRKLPAKTKKEHAQATKVVNE